MLSVDYLVDPEARFEKVLLQNLDCLFDMKEEGQGVEMHFLSLEKHPKMVPPYCIVDPIYTPATKNLVKECVDIRQLGSRCFYRLTRWTIPVLYVVHLIIP